MLQGILGVTSVYDTDVDTKCAALTIALVKLVCAHYNVEWSSVNADDEFIFRSMVRDGCLALVAGAINTEEDERKKSKSVEILDEIVKSWRDDEKVSES